MIGSAQLVLITTSVEMTPRTVLALGVSSLLKRTKVKQRIKFYVRIFRIFQCKRSL